MTRVGYPIGIRTTHVRALTEITPHMLRLTVGGPELAGFHTYQADDHVRVLLPEDGVIRMPTRNAESELDWPRPAPLSRKYTVRAYRPETQELDLDIVLHEGGHVSTWVRKLSSGDDVVLAGPPGAKAFAHTYSHYVLAVDPTGLPAAARWLDEAPAGVTADIVIDADHAAEHDYPLTERAGVTVTRLLRTPGRSVLAETVRNLALLEDTFCFVAGEADDIRPLRAWARDRHDSLFTGYWRRGVADLDD